MKTLEHAVADPDSVVATSDTASTVRTPNTDRKRTSMSVINFWFDLFLLLIVVSIGWISAVLRFVFPAPTAAGGWTLWGWTYDELSDFQFVCLCTLALAVLIHVMLHWNWVCSVLTFQVLKTRQRIDDGMQTIYGVGFLVVLLHIILAGVIAAKLSVVKPPM